MNSYSIWTFPGATIIYSLSPPNKVLDYKSYVRYLFFVSSISFLKITAKTDISTEYTLINHWDYDSLILSLIWSAWTLSTFRMDIDFNVLLWGVLILWYSGKKGCEPKVRFYIHVQLNYYKFICSFWRNDYYKCFAHLIIDNTTKFWCGALCILGDPCNEGTHKGLQTLYLHAREKLHT